MQVPGMHGFPGHTGPAAAAMPSTMPLTVPVFAAAPAPVAPAPMPLAAAPAPLAPAASVAVPLRQVVAEKASLVAEMGKVLKDAHELLTTAADSSSKVIDSEEVQALSVIQISADLKSLVDRTELELASVKGSNTSTWMECKASAMGLLMTLGTKVADVGVVVEELVRIASEQKVEDGKNKQKDKNRFQLMQRDLRTNPIGKTMTFMMAKLMHSHEKDPEFPCEFASIAAADPASINNQMVTRLSLDHKLLERLLELLTESDNHTALDQKVESLAKHLLKSKDPGACAPCTKVSVEKAIDSLGPLGMDVPTIADLSCPWLLAIGKKAVRFGPASIPFCGLGALVVGHNKMGPGFYIFAIKVDTIVEKDSKGLAAIVDRLDKDQSVVTKGICSCRCPWPAQNPQANNTIHLPTDTIGYP